MNLIRKAGFLLVCATMVAAGNGTAQNVQRTSQGIKCATQGMDVNVEFYSPSIVRVYKTPSQKSCNKESLVIVKTPESTPVSFGEKGKNVTLSSRLIQVEVNPETGGIHFFDSSGQRTRITEHNSLLSMMQVFRLSMSARPFCWIKTK